ncbi:WS/DGAT/MGAT family O-acyltransferase [Spongorhabdus nitratireducens]
MQQLSSLDQLFVKLEKGANHMHVGCLSIYDQSTAPKQPVRFKDIIKSIKNRLHALPELRQRYVSSPAGLDNPYWIADPNFDIEFHLRHIALPAPGDWRQLCILAARLHSRPIDLNHAPWEIYVIEGLNNVEGLPEGSFAMFIKLHHALFDGQAIARLMMAMHDDKPVLPQAPENQQLVVDRVPTTIEMLAKTPLNYSKKLFNSSKIAAKYSLPLTRWALSKQARQQLLGREKFALSSVPRTRFNQAVSPHRIIEGIDFDLGTIQAIRKALPGITVNDIALATVAGGLKRYLESKNELPQQSLRSAMPINVAGMGDGAHEGSNKLSISMTDLHTDIEDVKQRLVAIHESAAMSKIREKSFGGRILMDLVEVLPSSVSGMLTQPGIADKFPVLANTVISNVMGPNKPIYHTGARLVGTYGFGLPVDLTGLFHGIFGYDGKLFFGITACREMMPDPAFYKECLQEAFDELSDAILIDPESEEPEALSA